MIRLLHESLRVGRRPRVRNGFLLGQLFSTDVLFCPSAQLCPIYSPVNIPRDSRIAAATTPENLASIFGVPPSGPPSDSAFVFCRPVTWHKSRRISLLQTLSCPEPRRVRRKKTSTPLQSGKSRLFLQNTRGGGVSVTAPSASPRLFPSLTLSPLCFHGLTNCFSRKPFVLITLCVAPRGVPPLHAPSFISDQWRSIPAHLRSLPHAIIRSSTSPIGAFRMRSRILALASLLAAASLSAQNSALDAKVDQELPSLVTTYKALHAAPELSHHEDKTAAMLAHELRGFGYDVTAHVG